MATTNHTPTIELSQYASTDKTSYLVNYNDDMLKIDTAIATDRDNITTAQSTADTAEGKADTNKLAIDALESELNDPATGLSDRVAGNTSAINTINSLIGNGEPTTTDKTLIGAINEINSNVDTLTNKVNAKLVLATTPVVKIAEITADGVKTNSDLLVELRNAILSAIENAPTSDIYMNFHADINGIKMPQNSLSFKVGGDDNFAESFVNTNIIGADVVTSAIFLGTVPFYSQSVGGTVTSLLTDVPTNGTIYSMYAEHYIKL